MTDLDSFSETESDSASLASETESEWDDSEEELSYKSDKRCVA